MRFRVLDLATLMLAGAALGWCYRRYGFDARSMIVLLGGWAYVTFHRYVRLTTARTAVIGAAWSLLHSTSQVATACFWCWLLLGRFFRENRTGVAEWPAPTPEAPGPRSAFLDNLITALAACPAAVGLAMELAFRGDECLPGLAETILYHGPVLLFWQNAAQSLERPKTEPAGITRTNLNWLPVMLFAVCADAVYGTLNHQTSHGSSADFQDHTHLWAWGIAFAALPLSWLSRKPALRDSQTTFARMTYALGISVTTGRRLCLPAPSCCPHAIDSIAPGNFRDSLSNP